MKYFYNLISILFGLSLLNACTKADPKVESLGPSLEASTLAPDSTTVTSPQSVVSISGTCDARVKDMDVSFNSGGSWSSVSQVGTNVHVNCGSGRTFSFDIDLGSSSVSSQVSLSSSNNRAKILIRGKGKIGITYSSVFTVVLDSSSGDNGLVSAGGEWIQGGVYKIKGRVGAVAGGAASGGAYKVETGSNAR
jgi:hypothetical protein